MNETPLEDRVHDALHRRVDPIQHAPLTVTDVRRRAQRIQRRRAAVAGVAVAAALAIAVPVGLTMTGSNQRSEVPPATQPPSPTPQLASGTVLVDPRSAEVVEETPVPLIDVDGPSLITSDGIVDLPHVYDTLTPYLDGWVGVAMYDAPDLPPAVIEFLGADLRVDDGGSPTGGLVVSPDGRRIAWSEYDGSRWQVVVADPSGGSEWVYTTFPPSPEDHRVEPVGFVSEDEVAVRTFDNTVDSQTYVAGGGAPVEVPGLLQADAASPALGVVAGPTRYTPDGTCYAVVDALGRSGEPLWKTCDHGIGAFSPSGTYVIGTDLEADGYGSPTVAVLDAATGKEIVTFKAVLPRRTVGGGFWTQIAWEGDDALVVRLSSGDDNFMVRLGLDSSVQRIDIPSSGVSGLTVAVPS